MKHRTWLRIACSCFVPLVGCAATSNVDTTAAVGDGAPLIRHQQMAADADATNTGGLVVEVRDINVVSREARISGRVKNDYDQLVNGVRYRVELFSTDGERSLGTELFEVPVEIDAGATSRFRLTLQSMYVATIPRVTVAAVPIELGGAELPAPKGWD